MASYSVYSLLENSCDAGDKYFQIQIPESATKTECTYNGIQGVEYYLRFSLPSEELSIFLTKTCFGTELALSETYNAEYLKYWDEIAWKAQTWWTPEKAKIAASGSCWVNDSDQLHLLIDKTNPETPILYISSDSG